MNLRDAIYNEYKHYEPTFNAIFSGKEIDFDAEKNKINKINKAREPERVKLLNDARQSLIDRYPEGIPGSLLGRG